MKDHLNVQITVTSADGVVVPLDQHIMNIMTSEIRKEHSLAIQKPIKARMHYVTKRGAEATTDLLGGFRAVNREKVLSFVWALINALLKEKTRSVKLHHVVADARLDNTIMSTYRNVLKKLEKLGVIKTEPEKGAGTLISDYGLADPKFSHTIQSPVKHISVDDVQPPVPEGMVSDISSQEKEKPLIVMDVSDLSDGAQRVIGEIISLDRNGMLVNRRVKILLEPKEN